MEATKVNPTVLKDELQPILSHARTIVKNYEQGTWKEPDNAQLEASYKFAKKTIEAYSQYSDDIGFNF